MNYDSAKTVRGVEVRLYEDVIERIFRKHGELRDMRSLILETVSAPDLVLKGHGDELIALRHYGETPLGTKDMVGVYHEGKRERF